MLPCSWLCFPSFPGSATLFFTLFPSIPWLYGLFLDLLSSIHRRCGLVLGFVPLHSQAVWPFSWSCSPPSPGCATLLLALFPSLSRLCGLVLDCFVPLPLIGYVALFLTALFPFPFQAMWPCSWLLCSPSLARLCGLVLGFVALHS